MAASPNASGETCGASLEGSSRVNHLKQPSVLFPAPRRLEHPGCPPIWFWQIVTKTWHLAGELSWHAAESARLGATFQNHPGRRSRC